MQIELAQHKGWHRFFNSNAKTYSAYKEVDPSIYGCRTLAEYASSEEELNNKIKEIKNETK